jgi:hypothetical protein
MQMKALDALAKRIVPIPRSQVCIAYGDWSNHTGIKAQVVRDAADAPFETVEETEMEEMEGEETIDRAVHPPFETVGETASEIDSTTTAHTGLPPHHKSLRCIAWSTRRKTPTPV